jgi:glycosyltransferase involved in cell wall biosynthesis
LKVLIVSHCFWPESFRINDVAAALVAQGCEVTVLTGQPNYPEGRVFPGYRAMSVKQERHRDGYTIFRVPTAPRGKGRAMELARNYVAFVVNGCLLGPWLLRRHRFDVVFVYATSPVIQGFVGMVMKWTRQSALVTWVQDLWPESLRATGFVKNEKVLGLVERAVKRIYRSSDLILAQSTAFIPTISAMAAGTPVEYHPNPGETAFESPLGKDAPALLLKPGFNVVFAGNLGTVQALETVVAAARRLRGHPELRFVLIGSGSRLEWVRQQVEKDGLANIELPGRFPPAAMPGILSQASALLVSLTRSPIMSQTVPSKLQAYLAAGRPIICSLDGEGARIVQEAGAGVSCPAEDDEALANAVLALAHAGDEARNRMGLRGREYYDSHFEPTMLTRQLIHHFQTLAGSSQASPSTTP